MKHVIIFLLSAACLFGGDLSTRLELTLNRVLTGGPPQFTDAFILADAVPENTRRFTNFSGDVSGRYIGALAATLEHKGAASLDLDRIVAKLLSFQKPDGHFGGTVSVGKIQNSDMALLWGNGRLLIGLLEYYRLKARPEVLGAARKIGDFLISLAPLLNSEAVRREYNGERFAVGYICWTQNLEGLVELFRVTRDERYLALSKEMADRTDRHPSQHSHGFLTTLRGMVQLSRVTGERRYLARVEEEWKGVYDSGNVMAQGGVPEMFAPQIKRDEGCSEADWLRLALDLWQETGKPEYLKQAEYTLFNEFSFNQFPTGDFGHHTLTATGVTGPSSRAWWCCTFHGLRALIDVFASVFREKDGVTYYDLPVDGRLTAKGLSLRAESSLGQDATVRLEATGADRTRRKLAIRVPEWATEVTASLNGQKISGTTRLGYLELERVWKAGEALTLRYAMKTRLLTSGKPTSSVAVVHGPWLLAVDETQSPTYFDEPSSQNQALLQVTGEVELTKAEPSKRSASRLAVPVAHFKLNYLPGGYPVQASAAVLRPIAELTLDPESSRVDFWLPVKPQIEELDSNYKPKK